MNLSRSILCILSHLQKQDDTPANTKKQYYGPKWEEFKRYCELQHSNHPEEPVYFINADKVQNFIYYQCSREKQKVGGMKSGQKHAFDCQDYARVVKGTCGMVECLLPWRSR